MGAAVLETRSGGTVARPSRTNERRDVVDVTVNLRNIRVAVAAGLLLSLAGCFGVLARAHSAAVLAPEPWIVLWDGTDCSITGLGVDRHLRISGLPGRYRLTG